MSDATRDDKDEGTPEPPTAKPSKLVPIAMIANSVLLLGVLVKLFLPSGAHQGASAPAEKAQEVQKEEAPAEEAPGLGPTIRLPEFVVHLANPDAERYAKMTLELEIPKEDAKEAVTASMPRLRELIIAVLSDRTSDTLKGSEGIDRLKKDLMARFKKEAPTVPVRSVFVTDIVVQ